MPFTSPVDTIATVLLLLAVLPLYAFVGFYFRSPWSATPLGVSYMIQKIATALILTLAVLTAFFGIDFLLRDWFRLVVYASFLVTVCFDLITLVLVQRNDHKASYYDWRLYWMITPKGEPKRKAKRPARR